jgi:predicted RNA-binding Zn-ribbon protein involved in translation (DUF1610 family)
MKNFFIIGMLIFGSITLFAQSNTSNSKPTTTTTVSYYCPKCGAEKHAAGSCEACHLTLIKFNDYFCPKCFTPNGTEPNECVKCYTGTMKLTQEYLQNLKKQ